MNLYTRLLAQSVNELRTKRERLTQAQKLLDGGGQPHSENGNRGASPRQVEQEDAPLPNALDDPLAPPVTLDLPLRAEIPGTYVEEEGLRLQLYRRIAGLTAPLQLDDMRKEMIDRFGADLETRSVPLELENLFYQIRGEDRSVEGRNPQHWPPPRSDRCAHPSRVFAARNRRRRSAQR